MNQKYLKKLEAFSSSEAQINLMNYSLTADPNEGWPRNLLEIVVYQLSRETIPSSIVRLNETLAEMIKNNLNVDRKVECMQIDGMETPSLAQVLVRLDSALKSNIELVVTRSNLNQQQPESGYDLISDSMKRGLVSLTQFLLDQPISENSDKIKLLMSATQYATKEINNIENNQRSIACQQLEKSIETVINKCIQQMTNADEIVNKQIPERFSRIGLSSTAAKLQNAIVEINLRQTSNNDSSGIVKAAFGDRGI